jgi:hypothetical protein
VLSQEKSGSPAMVSLALMPSLNRSDWFT